MIEADFESKEDKRKMPKITKVGKRFYLMMFVISFRDYEIMTVRRLVDFMRIFMFLNMMALFKCM